MDATALVTAIRAARTPNARQLWPVESPRVDLEKMLRRMVLVLWNRVERDDRTKSVTGRKVVLVGGAGARGRSASGWAGRAHEDEGNLSRKQLVPMLV